jgi:uncharacterized membrane protein YjgN (DUF898 family)
LEERRLFEGGETMDLGVRCQKCGLMQLHRSTCKSCGAALSENPFTPAVSGFHPETKGTKGSLGDSSSIVRGETVENERCPAHRFDYHGRVLPLFGIYAVNLFLSLVTLGVYYFWGKIRVRNYLSNQTELGGDRFGYHGTGKELLIGFLRALLLFFIPLFALNLGPELLGAGPVIRAAAAGLAYGMVMLFVPVAMVGARRYRLSRASWRGIRFSFRGQAWDFLKIFAFGTFLSSVTLGLYYPFFDARRQEFMISHSYFGNRKFSFNGRGKDLFRPFLVTLLLTLPTLGFYWFWFAAKKQRYYWEHTTSGPNRLRSTVTGRALMNLFVGNFLIAVFTLGLGWPWIITRKIQFACRFLTLEGPLELAEIEQEAQKAVATGEAMSGFLDADFSLGG